jgi:hypothetical protein
MERKQLLPKKQCSFEHVKQNILYVFESELRAIAAKKTEHTIVSGGITSSIYTELNSSNMIEFMATIVC